MTEASRFWTTSGTGDGPAGGYTQAQFYDFLRKLFITDQHASQGIVYGESNELAVTGSATPISIATGSAIVYGFFYENTTIVTKAITTPSIGTTGFRVSLQANWTTQTIRINVLMNTDGNPAIPTLIQNPGTEFNLPLATGTVTTGGVITLTDARSFIQIGAKLQANAVDTNAITALAVTDAKLRQSAGLSVIGRSANTTGSPADIAAAVDAYVLRRSGTTLGFGQVATGGIADDAITSAKLGPLAVDNAALALLAVATGNLQDGSVTGIKLGALVNILTKRQGGHADYWSVTGTTNYTPDTKVRFEVGQFAYVAPGYATLTWPQAWPTGHTPLVLISCLNHVGYLEITTISENSLYFKIKDEAGVAVNTDFAWIAIGPDA